MPIYQYEIVLTCHHHFRSFPSFQFHTMTVLLPAYETTVQLLDIAFIIVYT